MRLSHKWFLKYKKNIILIHFDTKNTLKNNCNHTLNFKVAFCICINEIILLDIVNAILKFSLVFLFYYEFEKQKTF